MSVSFRCRRAVAPVLFLLLLGFGRTAAQAADWTWQNPLPRGNPLNGAWGSSGSGAIARDDFEDETIATPPVAPNVGSYGNSPLGAHLVQSFGGDKRVETTCTGALASWVEWYTIDSNSSRVRIDYRFEITAAPNLQSANAVMHTASAKKAGGGIEEISLWWSDSLNWYFEAGPALGEFSVGTEYHVVWELDFVLDIARLRIGGVQVAVAAIPNDPEGLISFSVFCNSATSVTMNSDDLVVNEETIFADDFELDGPEWFAFNSLVHFSDECPSPVLVGQGIDTPGTLASHSGTTGDDSSCGSLDTLDHWSYYVAQCTGTATATTCLPETEFDTVLAVYDGCTGTVDEIACNDDAVAGGSECLLSGSIRKSAASFPVVEGEIYRIRTSVYGDSFPSSDAKEFGLRVECSPTP